MAQNPETGGNHKMIVRKQNGERLVGVLKHHKGSPDVIVLCHGFRSSKASRTIVKIAKALEKEKFSTFRFDFSGNGESEGEFQFSNYWGEVDELRAVILHFTERGHRISAILGHSKGGNVVLLYASKYGDVPAVINVSGRFNLEKGLEERFGVNFMQTLTSVGFIDVSNRNGEFDYQVTLQCVRDRLAINMEESCSQIHKYCRVLTVHGSEDETAPVENASLFDDVISNHKKEIVEGADHCYTRHRLGLISAILSFIKDV